MANTQVIVERVAQVSAAAEAPRAAPAAGGKRYRSVTFASGNAGLVDISKPAGPVWAEVLESSRSSNRPVYVEVDANTNEITQVLIPLVSAVTTVTGSDSDAVIEVEFRFSHAKHYLRRTNPAFRSLLQMLRAAQGSDDELVVTETGDGFEILDVRPSPQRRAPEIAPLPVPEVQAPSLISLSQAYALFNQANSRICCPVSAPAPCIPFLYPDDGCWARAHEMCRIAVGQGIEPAKVWILGNLRVVTQNNPNCEVRWGWHVAPTVLVSTSGGGSETYVIDPSLFSTPVPRATWASVQGDPAPLLEPSDWRVFHQGRGGAGASYDDAAYTRTQQTLEMYRQRLRLRSVSSSGPPPYPNCMTRPPGTQWFGLIGPNATARWYTWGWPAAWHMVWTVVPLTPCPGRPQLTWRVQVERANATQCTYWISVTNLTGDAVRFEGRYDVLSR